MVQNILFITVDSLRFDHFSSPGVRSTEAPLFRDSTLFTSAYATGPGTGPSFPAMLTGTMPLSYGGLGPLTPNRPRVAAQLKKAGMTTGGFHSNPFLSSHFNYEAGFDEFNDYQNPMMGVATKIFPRGIEINNPKLSWLNDRFHLTDSLKWVYQIISGKSRPYVSSEIITEDTISWLSNIDEPFFAWAHYMDVHHPCFPPPEYREQFDVFNVAQTDVVQWYSEFASDSVALTDEQVDKLHRLYEASIAYTTDQVGRLLDYLLEHEKYENTLIILTSDHGELFGEHDQYGKLPRLYDELLHVPLLIVNGPEYLSDVSGDLVSLLDLPPLIHDALGIDIPDSYEGQLLGCDPPRNYIMAEHEANGKPIVGARSNRWLYEADEITGEHRLFEISEGGFERTDLGRMDSDAKVVRDAVLDRLNELDIDPDSLRDEVDGDIESRLEALGYL